MKSPLQGSGRPTATFASVKEHLQLYLQTQLERADDVVQSIEAMELLYMAALQPKRIAPKETNKDLCEQEIKDNEYLYELQTKRFVMHSSQTTSTMPAHGSSASIAPRRYLTKSKATPSLT